MPEIAVPALLIGGAAAYAATSGAVLLTHRLTFFAGIAALAVALVGPVDAHAHQHFAAHMVQHLLLVSVAAPLLALGRPLDVARTFVGLRSGRPPGIAVVIIAGAVQVTVLMVWHIPDVFQRAVENDTVHAAEHLTMLASAYALWATLFATRGMLRGVGLVVLFAVGLPPMAYGVALTVAPSSWYPAYSLADQQMAGVLMWAWGGAAATVSAVALFATWLTTAQAES